MDKEVCKKKGAWLHWFRCNIHSSKTYAVPCMCQIEYVVLSHFLSQKIKKKKLCEKWIEIKRIYVLQIFG